MQTITQNKTKNISISLSFSDLNLLDNFSKKERLPRSKLVSNALDFYIKNKLKTEIQKWLQERYSEYKQINSDFADIQFNSLKI